MHWKDIESKREIFGVFSGFPAKRQKVNPRTKNQLMVNPEFGAPKSQKSSLESVAQENSGRLTENRKVNLVNSEGPSQGQPCDPHMCFHIIKDYTRFGGVSC